MPVRVLDDSVDVLRELPRQPALADPRWSRYGYEPRPLLASRGVEEILEQSEVVVAADKRRFESTGSIAPADLGHDAQGAERGHRRGLALENLVTSRLECDGLIGRAFRGLADEHAIRLARPTAACWPC